MTLEFLIQGIFIGTTIAFIALGYSIIYSLLRFINFAHGEIVILAGYIFYTLFNVLDFSFFLSALLTIFISGCIGVVIERIAFKPLRARNRMAMLISSLGVSIIIKSLISIFFSSSTLVFNVEDPIIDILSYPIYLREILVLFLLIIIFIALNFSLYRYNSGLAIRAISLNPDLSHLLNIPVDKIISLAFFFSSCLAAVTGISLGIESGLTPSLGFQYSIWAFVVAIISGLGSIKGIFPVGILFGILINFTISMFSPLIAYAFALIIVSIVLLVKPEGLFSLKERIV